MSISLNNSFEKAAAWVAARLPYILATRTTLGFANKWYAGNGRYKFGAGQTIDIKKCAIGDYGSEPRGWVIEKQTKSRTGDAYDIRKTPEGRTETYIKWNIENQFAAVGKPRRPERAATPDTEAHQL